MVDVLAALTSAGKGAALGAAFGPPGIIAGTIIGGAFPELLGAFLPHLAPGAQEGVGVAQQVVETVAAAVGRSDGKDPSVADVTALPADKQIELREALAQIAVQAEANRLAAAAQERAAYLADVQSARSQTVTLAQSHSLIAWGAPVMSGLVMLIFFAVVLAVILKPLPIGSETVLNVLLGILGTAFTGTVQYWVGSSAGSHAKDAALAASVPADLVRSPQSPFPLPPSFVGGGSSRT